MIDQCRVRTPAKRVNNTGGSIGSVKVGPINMLNKQSWFYNPSASSTYKPSIYQQMNNVDVMKFRFPR